MKTNKEVAKDTERGKKSLRHFNVEHLREEKYLDNKKHSLRDKELRSLKKSKNKKDKGDISRFTGDGVTFKAKLIGTDVVNDARGDKMCQDSLQKLKAAVKSTGEHKQRVTMNVSLNGIQIKDDKTGEIIHQHPVHKISFISQDAGDARAFGYVFGCPQTGHQFFGIKTEKAASQIVICLRDLFQVVLEIKKKEMEIAIQQQKECEEEPKQDEINEETKEEDVPPAEEKLPDIDEGQLSEEITQDELSLPEGDGNKSDICDSSSQSEPVLQDFTIVDNLLDLQVEMDTLQQGIEQMDSSIAAAASFGFGVSFSEDDNSVSSGNSSILTPRKLESVASSLQLETVSTSSRSSASEYSVPTAELKVEQEQETSVPDPPVESPSKPSQNVEDKYSVFADIDSLPSLFDNPSVNVQLPEPSEEPPPINENEMKENNLEIDDNLDFSIFHELDDSNNNEKIKAKPPDVIFAELDPLGKDHPYVEKENFFQDIKNPPKKVLKDLIGEGSERRGSCPFVGSESLTSVASFDDKLDPPFNSSPFATVVNVSRSPPPPKLPPKRSFSVTSPLPSSPSNKECFENNFEPAWETLPPPSTNPFSSSISNINNLNTLPPSSPPPPPPPRLPTRVFDTVFQTPPSPPPRPPNRTCATPTPPLPRRKPPLSNTGKTWYSFDQDSTDHWYPSHNQLNNKHKFSTSSPPIPAPARKPPIPNRCESPLRNNMSPLNSPYFVRRQLSHSPAFVESDSSMHVESPSRPGRREDSLRNTNGLTNGNHPPVQSLSPEPSFTPLNPFDSAHKSPSKSCLNNTMAATASPFTSAPSPPLPPKSYVIPRPRPSPSKMLSSSSPTPLSCSCSDVGNGTDVIGSTNAFRSYTTSPSNAFFEEQCRPASVTSLSVDGNSDSEATSSNGYQNLSGKESEENSTVQEKEAESVVESPTSPDSIFRRKSDPFADEFFTSLPKKSSVSSNQATSVVQNNCSLTHNNGFQEEFEVDWEKAKEPVYSEVNKVKKEDST